MSVVLAQNPLNPLIAKDDVGRARRSGHSLPLPDHAYGKPNPVDQENARTVTSSWAHHVPSESRIDSNSINFLRLNGSVSRIPHISPKAIQAIASKIKERQKTEPKILESPSNASSKPHTSTHLVVISHKPLDPPRETFKDIIQNKYGNRGEEESLARYQEYHDYKHTQSLKKTTIKQTRASRGRSSIVAATPITHEPFKLTKFKKIPSRYMTQ